MAEEVNKEIVEKQIGEQTPPDLPDVSEAEMDKFLEESATRYGFKSANDLIDAYLKHVTNKNERAEDAVGNMYLNTMGEQQERDKFNETNVKRNEDGTIETPIKGVDAKPNYDADIERRKQATEDMHWSDDFGNPDAEVERQRLEKIKADANPFREIANRQYSKWDEK